MKGPLVTGRVRGTIAAVALGGVLALTGCGTNDTAAVVDGSRISQTDAALAAQQINKQFKPDAPLTTSDALGLLIIAPTIISAAEASGHPQSEESARSRLGAVQDPSDATVELVRANTALQAFDQTNTTALLKQIRALTVSLNPRYGTFDAAKPGIVAKNAPWISTSGS